MQAMASHIPTGVRPVKAPGLSKVGVRTAGDGSITTGTPNVLAHAMSTPKRTLDVTTDSAPASGAAEVTTSSNPFDLPADLAALGLKWTPSTSAGQPIYYATDPNNSNLSIVFHPGANNGAGGYDVTDPYTGQYDSGLKSWPTTLAGAFAAFGGVGIPDDIANPPTGVSPRTGGSVTPKTNAPSTTAPAATTATSATDSSSPENVAAGLLSGTDASVPGSGSIAGDIPVAETTSDTSGGDTSLALVAVVAAIAIIGFYLWYRMRHKKKAGGEHGDH